MQEQEQMQEQVQEQEQEQEEIQEQEQENSLVEIQEPYVIVPDENDDGINFDDALLQRKHTNNIELKIKELKLD